MASSNLEIGSLIVILSRLYLEQGDDNMKPIITQQGDGQKN